jgi:hypothetical protein
MKMTVLWVVGKLLPDYMAQQQYSHLQEVMLFVS